MTTYDASRSRRILVVDDDAAAREALRTLLADEGCEVITASNGVSAFAKLATLPADLVLADVRMPRMNGPALFDAMREVPGRRPKLIFMSASPHPEDDTTPFLAKPIDFNEMLTLLRA